MSDEPAGAAFSRSLVLDEVATDSFRAPIAEREWLYGGHLLALGLRAAALTGPEGWEGQSLHAQFVGRGDASQPLGVTVDRVRDGSSLCFRGVQVIQNSQVLVTAQVALHRAAEGPNYHQPFPSGIGSPEELDGREPSDWSGFDANLGVDVREDMNLAANPEKTGDGYTTTRRLWVRLPGLPQDDAVIAQCAMAFLSDMRHGMALKPALGLPPLGRSAPAATTSHTMWFHRAPTSPGWLLLDYQPLAAASNIGLASCNIFDQTGAHLSTTAQDVLYRLDG